MDIPIDIIIKILSYYKRLVPYVEFLKSRLLRKKIAAAFRPKCFLYTYKRSSIKKLPKHITTLKLQNDQITTSERLNIANLIDKNPHINKIDVIILDKIYYIWNFIPFINYDYNYSNITVYKGPDHPYLKEFVNLKKLTLHLHKDCTLYLNVRPYVKLEYLCLMAETDMIIHEVEVNSNLKTFAVKNIGFKKEDVSPEIKFIIL
jgi:hypothetical protein